MATGGYTVATSLPAAGTYTVVATYAGDANFGASSKSSTMTVTAAPLQTTSVGIVAPATAIPGTAFNVVIGFNVFGAFTTQPSGSIVLTATLAGSSPTTIATVTPAQGMAPGGANVSVTLPNAGVYTLNANYAGDKLYAATTNTATVTVNGFPTTVKISAAANPKAGVAFNATVLLATTGSTVAPTGNVVITATPAVGSPATVATITAAAAFATGGASVPITLANAGSYTLTATYAGAGPYTGSSGTATVSVAGFATTLALTISPASPSANSSFDVKESFTATGSTTPPAGSITLTLAANGGTPQVVLTSNASDVFGSYVQTSALTGAPGTYVLTATYPGAGIYQPSTAQVKFTIAISPTTLTLTGPSTGKVGTAVNFTLLLTANLSEPTGNITLTSMSNGVAGPSATVDASDATTLAVSVPLTFTTGGTYTVTANYPGDASTTPSASNSLTVTVAAYTGPPSFAFTRDTGDIDIHMSGRTAPASLPVTLSSINGFATPVVLSFGTAADPNTPLTTDNSTYMVVAVDHATQKPITSVTPLPKGAHVDLLISSSDGSTAHNENPFDGRLIELGAGLGFLGLLGIRKRARIVFAALLAVCVIAGAASIVAGCGNSPETIVVTATPTDKTTPAQTLQFDVTH
jgi:large repetitive protein